MRPEELYLTDIIEAADAIQRFVRNVDQNTFLKDELIQSAVLQKLMIIGDHAYFAVEWSIVWVAATQETPHLRRKIAEIVARE
jgi:uncharacterized protein with HEPN domain